LEPLDLADVMALDAVRSVAKVLARRWRLTLGFAPTGAHTPASGPFELTVPVGGAGAPLGWLTGGDFVPDESDAAAHPATPRLGAVEAEVALELLRTAAEEVAAVFAEARRRPAGERASYDAIVGPSGPMQELYQMLDRVVASESTVLIQGENGTGKELIARAIHFHSPRRERRFLVQNCSAFNDNLLDSELFGHKKGAFTGAVADKLGLFDAADGGTFFLDEIGDMSPALQVKLLRVLQEGTFMPVGDTATREVDVRIIAATHRDLKAMVAAGTFREDLYYRVNVINLVVPPLRERRDDIPVLVEHFLKRRGRGRRPGRRLSRACLDTLAAYAWPGNVRELENEIERLVVLAGDERLIGAELLSPRIRSAVGEHARAARGLPGAVEELERRLIDEALRRHGGNKTRAARELLISRRNLIRLVQKYQLAAGSAGSD
jgi:transcriptional regulator with PAS, ATPase and Fis domain